MSIRRMREYAQLVGEGEGNELERLALLDEHRANVRAQLTSLQGTLAELEAKIALYRRVPVPPTVENASSPVSSAESVQSRAASSR